MRHEPTLEGNCVELRPLEPANVSERYVAWLNDPDVTAGTEARYTHHTVEDVRAYVEQTIASPSDKIWRVMVPGEGHVGNIRLSTISEIHHRARIALLIGEKSVWGRGIGSAAIDRLARHAFEDLGLCKLSAGIYATNPGSRRAFEKATFSLEATLKDEAFVDDHFVDVWLMARFAENLHRHEQN